MRILVASDSHGCSGLLERIIRREQKAKHIFFLGDVLRDIEDIVFEYPDRIFHTVAGNCDYFSPQKSFDICSVENHKILFAHGHSFYVKSGDTGHLKKYALQNGCDIALYGHTHIASVEYSDGLYIVNPGSVGRSRDGGESYAVIDILENGILPQIKRI